MKAVALNLIAVVVVVLTTFVPIHAQDTTPFPETIDWQPKEEVVCPDAIADGAPRTTFESLLAAGCSERDAELLRSLCAEMMAREGVVVACQSNGVNLCYYLMGGASLEPNGMSIPHNDAICFNPILRTATPLATTLPEGLIAAIPIAANHILLFYPDPDGEDELLMTRFHTITSTFTRPEAVDTRVAVASVVAGELTDDFTLLLTALMPTGQCIAFEGQIVEQRGSMGWINWSVIVLYFLLLAGVGAFFSRRQKNTNDYFKGGGRIPWWAAGLSLFGTALSAITFMAIPAKAYATDWSYALFNMGIVLVAPIIVCLFIPYFRGLNITTAYQYLEARFSPAIRVFCSLCFIVFQVGRMGVVLFLPSIALNVVTGMDILLCIAIMGVCSILYTMVGGIEAVVWTDAIQVLILLGGALVAVAFIICSVPGGLAGTLSVAMADAKFSLGSTALSLKDATVWTVLIAACFTNLTTYGTDQSMVQRYLTTSSEAAARKSVWTNALLTIPATIVFFFIGTALYVYYKTFPEKLSIAIAQGDAIFPWYIFSELPAGVVGLLVSGIFAAAMSTLSGSMNSAATAYVVDIYPHLRGKADGTLRTARFATFIIGAISLSFAFVMATWSISSLWDTFQSLLGLILGSMGGLFMLGMLTRRATAAGAWVGVVASVALQLTVMRLHAVHLLLYTAVGFIGCFVVGYLASLILPSSQKKSNAT